MKLLEAVYLANVILYIKSIETIIKLIQVNKKCQEATKIIRYFKTRKLSENENEINYVVVKNLFDLFPNVETVNCGYQDIRNNLEIIKKVKQIQLSHYQTLKMDLSQEIKDKIIQLDINCYSLENIQLNEFPNVKKAKICYYFEKGNLIKFLGDNQSTLQQLILQVPYDETLNLLREYKNIKNKIIIIKGKLSKERYLELKSFANVYSNFPINGIDFQNTLDPHGIINITNDVDINKIYQVSLFTKCFIENDCDLRSCGLLEEIKTVPTKKNIQTIQIEGLNHLKKIENIRKVDCIPFGVTFLSFGSSFNYNESLEKDSDCFNNIKEVKFEISPIDYFEDLELFAHFRNCTKIALNDYNNPSLPLKFPIKIKELIIDKCASENQMKEIAELTELKNLTIGFKPSNDRQQIQKLFDNLKVLEFLRINYVEGMTIPSTITALDFNLTKDVDLGQYINLKEIRINCYGNKEKEIKLPKKLNKLYIIGGVMVINSNEIEVSKVILNQTPSQFCEWKSNNIFIEKEYKK